MQCFSYLIDNVDVIEHCLSTIKDEQYVKGKASEVEQKCIDKIIPAIQYFVQNKMVPDGRIAKGLGANIIEFRISLPKSNHLLRIIAGYRQNEVVLLTGYLIKEVGYSDKNETERVEREYNKITIKAKEVRKNFMSEKKYEYVKLENII